MISYSAKTKKETIIDIPDEVFENNFEKEQKLLELDNWFKTKYTEYEQMLIRREKLGIEDIIEDEFRNKTYHNIIELYEEAEVVAGEIRELREK